ncbi:glycosyltransferase family 2 protein [Intrasporangium flavum]|uniref:glycosyltransferase family 2 protein n=1 Tax=Intrasporangium flavum TaxID=1428657 RepID=UPI00096DC758|nr:glycosyltransferase family 2 protein [Intrasporangium flavum]
MPAYNEGASIAVVLAEVLENLPDTDVLVVDDGSRDDTARIARQFPVRVASHPFNVGVGGAMRTGFRYAAERGYAVVIQIDADGQHVAEQARALIDATSIADVVIGSRFASGDGYEVHPVRFASMRVVAGLMSRVVRSPLTDSTSGFRAFSRSAIELFAQHYPCEYLGDTVESLVLARRTGLRVVEVPVSMRPRLGGTPSQNTIASVGYAGRAVATIFLGLVRPRPVMTGVVR